MMRLKDILRRRSKTIQYCAKIITQLLDHHPMNTGNHKTTPAAYEQKITSTSPVDQRAV